MNQNPCITNSPQDRIRVIQIIPSLITGGAQQVALDLTEYLDRDKFDVRLISLFPKTNKIFENYAEIKRLPITYLNKQLGFDIRSIYALNKEIRNFRPHIIHNHLYALYASIPSFILFNIPVKLHTIHNLAEKEASGIHFLVANYAIKRLYLLPVSISKRVQKSVFSRYGVLRSPIIYNGIDVEKFNFSFEQRRNIRDELKIHKDKFVFINVASLSQQKNQNLLIKSFKKLIDKGINCFLLIVGDGPLRSQLEDLSAALGVKQHIMFLGIRSDINSLLSASDCFVLSSDWEGLPICVLEAMAAKRPVIATDVGGVPELVHHLKNGYLVVPKNSQDFSKAMEEVIADKAEAIKMGNYGRKLVEERFSVQIMANNYAKLYLDELNKAGLYL